MAATKLGGMLGCMVVAGGFLLWHYGRNATMPTLAEETGRAPSPQATRVDFRPGAWGCTAEEFRLQVLDGKRYYASPVAVKIVGGPPEFCREIDSSHDYALQAPAAADTDSSGPCPDRSCVAFVARVAIDDRAGDWTLYAPNSFIASAH
ncbi:hypothetical protein [Rhodanobacter sp. DHG33]|uniref:hypothetical protein n=1 Tax=Rhodanobacter sp. DHG33 TaxID=2775921 RepID=UPI00177F709F|nr:hypothetical protein [Rhodanobacter sp. DHG33]MBD8898147.1 hypothetical protein [Rhodanobacter sp. DHG33]